MSSLISSAASQEAHHFLSLQTRRPMPRLCREHPQIWRASIACSFQTVRRSSCDLLMRTLCLGADLLL